jgi:nicotinamidase-related amidase
MVQPKPWDGRIPEDELEVFALSGHGQAMGWGRRPALLIVDTTVNFIGDRPLPVLESIADWPYSCGEAGWEAAASISRLLEVARAVVVPTVFTTGVPPGPASTGPGRWADKGPHQVSLERLAAGHAIPEIIQPAPGEMVLAKEKPSAFFATPLPAYLFDRGVDSVIVCGGTTSGCVRSTVIDAFSYNLRAAVVAEATFDRAPTSHAVSLFDLDQKYADVVTEDETIEHLRGLETTGPTSP